MQQCPKCKSTNTIKNGVRTLKNGSLSFKHICHSCGKNFTIRTDKTKPLTNAERQKRWRDSHYLESLEKRRYYRKLKKLKKQ